MKKSIHEHYNRLAPQRDSYIEKNQYYYSLLFRQYQFFIPPQKKVLEVGCGTGALLNAVNPSLGVGVDLSEGMIRVAQEKYPHLKFNVGEIQDLDSEEKFDYIILSGLLGELEDIQGFLVSLRRFCTKDTRIIIEYYSYLWQNFFKFGEKFNFKIVQIIQNWLTFKDIRNFCSLGDYEVVKCERKVIFPYRVPVLSTFLNKYIANLPLINALTMTHFIIARPVFKEQRDHSVTIVVPCRNEKGNIEAAITRTPAFGSNQEFIFVEGNSRDGTYEEVERVIAQYPDKDIKLFKQTGVGKGDAVRLGFAQAKGEILMILDADLTVAPEDMPKFYQVLCENKGEFINGCRLIYPMEKQAMRFLNLIANKFFGVLFTWLLGQHFKDTLCGTKVIFKHHYEQLVKNRSYFGDFDPFGDFDLIFGAAKMNLKVIELPIRYRDRTYGSTQISRFRHGLLLFRMCFFALRKIKFY